MSQSASSHVPAVQRRHPPTALMRYVNPVMRRLAERGRAGDSLLLLHYTGRRSGRSFDVVAGWHDFDGQVVILTNAPWRHNFAGGRDIEVTFRGRRRPARVVLISDPEQVADLYAAQFARLGVRGAQRRMGVKVNVGRQPTRSELLDAVSRYGLAVLRVELPDEDKPAD